MSVLCELEASTMQLKDLKREFVVRDPRERPAAADRNLELRKELRKLEGPIIVFATSDALSAYFAETTKATTLEEELKALEGVHSAVCEQAKAQLHLSESLDHSLQIGVAS